MAPVIETVRYDSWPRFKSDLVPELFCDGVFSRGRYLFRGVGSDTWHLQASFDRLYGHLSTETRVSLWAELLRSFADVCREFGVTEDVYRDEVRLIALGQHNGLPTRLLDWTVSPYVAAYFAFRHALNEPADASSWVAVWALRVDAKVWSAEYGADILVLDDSHNPRLKAQGGRFTYLRSTHSCLEEYAEAMSPSVPALVSISMPVTAALQALPDLEAMGIHAGVLFPDATGLAEAGALRATFKLLAGTLA